MQTLIIDNYDSFTYNLYQYVGELGGSPTVVRNDKISLAEIKAMAPSHIIISPGPGDPRDEAYFGLCAQAIRTFGPSTPILGVCLGHQGIGFVYGGTIAQAPQIMHGKTSRVRQGDPVLFAGLAPELEVMRYHSLIVERAGLPDELEIIAENVEDGLIMGLKHKHFPTYGIQFHPESVGTPTGKRLLENFLRV